MNVLYLINYAGSGGTEAYVEGLISRLHPQTARCTLCYHIAGSLSERLRARGVETVRLPMRHPFDRRAAKALAACCREKDIDLIHAQYPRETMIALRAQAFGSPAQVIYTAHLSRRQPPWWRVLNRIYLPRAAAVIALRPEQKPLLVRNGVPADRLCVIPNGVDYGAALPRAPHDGPKVLLTAARLSPEKGLRFLCEAAAALREKTDVPFRVRILGEGPQREKLERVIAKKHLAGLVELVGYCPDVPAALAQADVYVSPSRTETMSLAVLEAMAAGLPVAATEASAALVADCGLTAPYGDVSAFSDVLKRLLEDDTLRETLGNRAARRRFDRNETCRRTAELYQRSLKHGTEEEKMEHR